MEHKNKALRKIVISTCVIYTAITLFILLISSIFSGVFTQTNITAFRFLLIFPFAVCLACLNLVYSTPKLAPPAKFFLHFAGTVICFYIFMCLPIQSHQRASSTLIILILFSIIYVAAYFITFAIIKKSKKKDDSYNSKFR